MSERAQIVVVVAADGTVRAETRGVLGERCLDFVAVLEYLIEGQATESAYNADWNRRQVMEEQEERDIDRS